MTKLANKDFSRATMNKMEELFKKSNKTIKAEAQR